MQPISVINPIGWAIERTKFVLFRPFNFSMWLTLGFSCFLANVSQYLGNCCQGPGNWNPGGSSGSGSGGGFPSQSQIQQWLPYIILGVVVFIILAIGIGALMMWLESRGRFMFLDCIVLKRGAVVEPWKTFRAHGNSLFKFRFVFGLLAGFINLAVIALAVAIAWPDIQAQQFGSNAALAIFGGGGLLFVLVIAAVVIDAVLTDFIVPVMYARNEYCLAAWGVFRRELLANHVGSFVLFYLMKILLGMAVGSIMLVGTCITCCIAGLPYVQNVVFLPLFAWQRLYPLAFMEQFGPEWAIISRYGGHYCRWCNHDLRYSDRSGLCPQCGRWQHETAEAPAMDAPQDGV